MRTAGGPAPQACCRPMGRDFIAPFLRSGGWTRLALHLLARNLLTRRWAKVGPRALLAVPPSAARVPHQGRGAPVRLADKGG